MALMGQSLDKRLTQVKMFSTRLIKLGGNHPIGRRRLLNRAALYLVFRLRRERLSWRRVVSVSRILTPL
jgi:hypothetical protein